MLIEVAGGLAFSYTVSIIIALQLQRVDFMVGEGFIDGIEAVAGAVGGLDSIPVSGCGDVSDGLLGSGMG